MKTKKKKSTVKCKIYNLSPSYCYKKFRCRCEVCRKWKKQVDTTVNREVARIKSKQWRLNNPERSRKNSKTYQQKHPEKLLEWQLKKYNITLKQYKNMLNTQNNKCAICEGKPQGMQNSKKRLCVDHDKITGKVRGLLCGHCNVGIGNLKHSVEILTKSIKYLEERGNA